MNSFDFMTTPQIQGNIPRSKFNSPHNVLFTGNVGELIPFEVTEILPGDNLKRDTNCLVRLQTLITPMMTDLSLDTWYFFVPNRLVWEHWQEFCGENKQSAWTPTTEYNIPLLNVKYNNAAAYSGSVADYFGVPYVTKGLSVNSLPFRAYGLIYNEWFRDEAIQDPVLVPTDDSTYQISSERAWNGKPYLAGKYHDYFTSALPSPQRGPDVSIPLAEGRLPVISADDHIDLLGDSDTRGYSSDANLATGYYNLGVNIDNRQGGRLKVKGSADAQTNYYEHFQLSNLWADIGTGVPVATINTLRMAFATQHLYEIDANGGRYVEILRNHFGVISPDARLQRPELISYNHFDLNIAQVVQTSETKDTPQGTTTAYSVTGDSNKSFDKSFVEHGFVIGIACVRYKNIYQQGLHRMWSRSSRFDYYWPVFANLGNQPVFNKEIFAQGTDEDNEVFGYQEAWAEYRYTPDRVAGEMRSSNPQSLDVWHLADYYETLPTLSPDWITVDGSTVNRVLAVSDNVSNQLLFDFNIDDTFIRPMPVHSIPGLNRM